MTQQAYLYDDPADVPRFLPFTESRPIGELRYGAYLLRERWAAEWGEVVGHIAQPHLASFTEPGAPPVIPSVPTETARWCFRSAFLPEPGLDIVIDTTRGPCCLRDHSGAEVGCFLPPGTPWPGLPLPGDWHSVAVDGVLLDGVWQLVGSLVTTLRSDLEGVCSGHLPTRVPAGCTVLGDAADLIVEEGAHVEPLVVFDLRNGPVWIQTGTEIRAFARLAGPLAVGQGTRIVGGPIRESSIGPRCVVHGEVSNTIFLGYANKAHDGFVGHSVVGRWANLGAGTITSNLKHTYGPVRVTLGGTRHETGLTFLGSLVGDHVKTAIGTMLPTGCVIATGANVFGSRRPDPFVPAFAWGTDEPDVLSCKRFIEIAERVMPRRDVAVDDAMRAYLRSVWQAATGRAGCD